MPALSINLLRQVASDAALASFGDYADAAVVVIGRGGGEGGDLARDMEGSDENYEPGQTPPKSRPMYRGAPDAIGAGGRTCRSWSKLP